MKGPLGEGEAEQYRPILGREKSNFRSTDLCRCGGASYLARDGSWEGKEKKGERTGCILPGSPLRPILHEDQKRPPMKNQIKDGNLILEVERGGPLIKGKETLEGHIETHGGSCNPDFWVSGVKNQRRRLVWVGGKLYSRIRIKKCPI